MIRIQLAPAEKEKCINFLIHILTQERAQQRINVLYLVNQGVIVKEVARLCNLSQNTIIDYIKWRIEALETLSFHQPAVNYKNIKGEFRILFKKPHSNTAR